MNNKIRRVLVGLSFLAAWEIGARLLGNDLIFPTLMDTIKALGASIADSESGLRGYVWETCKALFAGFGIGTLVATILTVLAINTKIGDDALSLVTGAFAPLPAVAVFPIALMIFGITFKSLLFIAAFATVFPVAVAMSQGFRAVSGTLRNVGKNLGMSGLQLTTQVLIPASLPSILSGLRSGFANAFRALVAVEMVVGAATGKGGLGWFVMSSKQNLDIPTVYAGIIVIMLVGLAFEGVFRFIEAKTVKKWGMIQ